ncbi:hypothetical protein [Caballeronia catudaia]|uniref:hypothetical protein n=1 Tax=Caballeronia catudaia TaxID=1777136 RepID=UPI001356ED66|nr:hypothetical protein [Caballeronia catudaia]
MNAITRVDIDLAKNVMQIHAVDQAGRVVLRKTISREKFLTRECRVLAPFSLTRAPRPLACVARSAR